MLLTSFFTLTISSFIISFFLSKSFFLSSRSNLFFFNFTSIKEISSSNYLFVFSVSFGILIEPLLFHFFIQLFKFLQELYKFFLIGHFIFLLYIQNLIPKKERIVLISIIITRNITILGSPSCSFGLGL